MLGGMYLWSLFGHDLMKRPVQHGITDDLAKAMHAAEPLLKDGRAFICVIEEVRMRISVTGLEENYAPTGKRWNGRRTTSDGVHWRLCAGSADVSLLYGILEGPYRRDLRDLRGLVA
jgi:hypothetical protein